MVMMQWLWWCLNGDIFNDDDKDVDDDSKDNNDIDDNANDPIENIAIKHKTMSQVLQW